MEPTREIEFKHISDIKKVDATKLLEINVQKCQSKKKFCNTVFAIKMRNRRKEKLEKLINESNKDLMPYKSASIEMNNNPQNTDPMLASSVDHKNNKKKLRFLLDQTDDEKFNDEKIATLQPEDTCELSSDDNNVKKYVLDIEEELVSKELPIKDQEDVLLDKNDDQRKETIKEDASMMFFNKKHNFEMKSGDRSIIEENFSCRRTEVFFGKLNTKEARMFNVEKILEEKKEPLIQNIKNMFGTGNEKKLLQKSEEINNLRTNQSLSELKNLLKVRSNPENYTNLKDNIHETENTLVENEDVVDTLTNIEKESINLGLKCLSEEVIKTKENITVDVPTCRRALPFVNQYSQNISSGVFEKLIETDCMDSDVNTNKLDPSNNIKIKLNCPPKDTKIVELNILKSTDINNSLNDCCTKSNESINNELEQADSLKNKSELECSVQDGNKKTDSFIELEVKEKSFNDVDLDYLSNDINSKTDDPSHFDKKEENLTCQRTQPYLGKNYLHCSRTLSFIDVVKKKKFHDAAQTSIKLSNIASTSNANASSKSYLNDSEKLKQKLKRNEEANGSGNVETKLINSINNNNVNIGNDISDVSVQNGEWKFRRKRPIESENKEQVPQEYHKCCKIKLSPDSLKNKKLAMHPVCSERTICSLLSLNCRKYGHNSLYNRKYLKSQKVLLKCVYVVLTKLEYSQDPLILKYLKKTAFNNKFKQNLLSSTKKHINNDKISTSLKSWRSVSHGNVKEQVAKDQFFSGNEPDMISNLSYNGDQIAVVTKVEDNINPLTAIDRSNSVSPRPITRSRRRLLSRNSTESPIIFHKQKKHQINSTDNSSGSDTSESISSISKQQTTHLQNRPMTLSDRQNPRAFSSREMDENDMEVEEFTRIGLKNITTNIGVESSNLVGSTSISQSHATEDSDSFNRNSRSRTASISEIVEGKPNIQLIHKALSLDSSNKFGEESFSEYSRIHTTSEDKDKNVEEDEIITNHIQLRSRDRISSTGHHKSLQQTELKEQEQHIVGQAARTTGMGFDARNDRIPSTFKISRKNDSATTIGKKSKLYKINEFDINKKIVSSTLSAKSSKRSKSTMVEKHKNFEFKSQLFNNFKRSSKNIQFSNLKVQLIRLETVCESFEDYSASEIELLTRKYIDLLMNSNFTCDTWRNPINYQRSKNFVEKHAEQVDNSDCISDAELQEENILTNTTNQNGAVVLEDDVDTANKAKPIKSNLKQIESTFSSFTTLESAIATLVDAEPGEQRNFGAINISEVLNSSSDSLSEKEKDQTVSNELIVNNTNQRRISLSDKHPSEQDNILVSGTSMFTCSVCNRIFATENLLRQHQVVNHNGNATVATDTTDFVSSNASKFSTKQKCQSSIGLSSKKPMTIKCKKKLRCSESLTCTICSVIFDSKEVLFDHIMTHNEQELQEAYKSAKAKAKQQQSERSNSMSEDSDKDINQVMENSQNNETQKKKNKENNKRKKSIDSSNRSSRSSMDVEDLTSDDPLKTACNISAPVTTVDVQQQLIDLDCLESLNDVDQLSTVEQSSKTITICTCHAHETTPQDLQIEMILLCKTCNVVFRRRECFEVHYRTSLECRRRRTNNEVTKLPKLFCSGCPCVLDSLMEMRAHLEMHARKNCQGTVTFICNICKVAFFGVGGIFYSHWFNHTKAPNFVASRYSFPKLSVVSVVEDSNLAITTNKSQEGFFYIAEHVCRQCRLPFSSEPELMKHKAHPCQSQQSTPRLDSLDTNRLQMIKLICDLCKKYYVSKENFDKHCSERNHLKTPITKFSRLPINANEQAFVCSLCRAVSKSLDELKEHWKRIHSPIMELYTCKTCNIVPSNDVTNYTYDKFERHCRIVHKSEVITCLVYFVTARYVCNICRFGFETEKSMKEHQVVHQKRSSQNNNGSATSSGVPVDSQMTTLWVPDKHVAVDCARKMHPMYMHYSGITNKRVAPILPALSKNPNQDPSQPRNSKASAEQTNASSSIASNSTCIPDGQGHDTNTSANNSVLRSMLAQKTVDHAQAPERNSAVNLNVETIFIDSRSNSPTTDNPASTLTDKSGTAGNDAAIGAKKSYMTMVNPNFELLLGTNSNLEVGDSNNVNSLLDKDHSGGTATPVSMDSLTPQPFEVVLVTDDLSENSNCESPTINERSRISMDKVADLGSSASNQQKHQMPNGNEISSAKSSKFLRVRSIAELQHMKIHLCSICGSSFDTLHAYDQHSRQHELAGEINRMTPVQMISPMLSQGNKEVNDPQSMLISQSSQKTALLTPNGKEMPQSYDLYNKSKSLMASNQMHHTSQQQSYHQYKPIQHEQQQHHSYWFASCNDIYNASQPNLHYNGYSRENHQHSNEPPIQQQTIMRRPVNFNNSGGSYMSRGPPPSYPSTSNQMAPSRSSAIQLPERNTTGSTVPTPKRPSGAATRIPQQSLPSFANSLEHRQPISRLPYALNENVNNTRMGPNSGMRNSQSNQYKTYNRNPGEMSYSGSMSSNPDYHNPQQQPSKIIYTCKLHGCLFRTDNILNLRVHEKSHMIQQMPTMPTNLMQQQQRLPMKHVPVSQMPERTRHAIPNSRQTPLPNIVQKRYICRSCNIFYNTSAELLDHTIQCHSTSNKQLCCYICDYCSTPLIFDSAELLSKHMNSYHNYFCELCNKRYPAKEDLLLHMEEHARDT